MATSDEDKQAFMRDLFDESVAANPATVSAAPQLPTKTLYGIVSGCLMDAGDGDGARVREAIDALDALYGRAHRELGGEVRDG